MDKLEAYVRSTRLVELHRLYAQDEPYHETSRGSVKPHPGWELAEREERRRHALALELGLEQNGSSSRSSGGSSSSGESYKSRLQQEAEETGIVQSAVGPDGMSL